MARTLKLTDPQFAFLGALVKGSREATVNYPPAMKLVELGFATQVTHRNEVNGLLSSRFYSITDAGRAHHQKVYMADKRCSKCTTAPWTCRVCSRKTCEHYCGSKSPADKTAISGRSGCRK